MYTIKEAASRTGLSVPVIRVWERRYRVVQPSRTPAGYRLYDDESIARLVAMRHLVTEEGWRPSQAAQRVLEPGIDLRSLAGTPGVGQAGAASIDRYGGELPVVDPVTGAWATEREAAQVDAFIAAAGQLDVEAMERILDEGFASQRFELAIEHLVSPALRAIGDAWARGEIDVGAEHAASETVRRRIARFFDASGVGDRVPSVVVGLPPEGHHEIGAFSFAVAARRAGLGVLYLGANVPLESWLRTVQETGAPAVVLGVVTQSDVMAAGAVVDALRRSSDPPICFVGGPLSARSIEASGAIRLPASLDDSVAAVRRLLGDGGTARALGVG